MINVGVWHSVTVMDNLCSDPLIGVRENLEKARSKSHETRQQFKLHILGHVPHSLRETIHSRGGKRMRKRETSQLCFPWHTEL
jgi:hypothetical protein